jgi:alcohol dehydrogenase class IV
MFLGVSGVSILQGFELYSVNRVVFGRGAMRRVGELAATLASRLLVIHNGPAVEEKFAPLLAASDVTAIFRRQRGEPVVADVNQAVQQARAGACDGVIGCGGGSAIDAAKAVAALLANGGSAIDYMEVVGQGQKLTRPSIPWMAIPTTAGSGAEATRNAVIGLPDKQFKASIRGERTLATIVVVDAELGCSTPPAVTASSGMDAICQLVESYTSIGANPVTDALALQGLHRGASCLQRAYADGGDIEAREGMALAALLSGMTLSSAGLGAVHGLAAPLGANFPIPHGTVCAALLAPIVSANVATLREQNAEPMLARYAALGRQLPGPPRGGDDQAIDALLAFITDLKRELQIPPLNQFGLKVQHIPAMIALARKASSMKFNHVVLSDDALAQVMEAAMEGR